MRKVYPPKGPLETLKYGFNWTPRNIGTERIILINATVVSGTVVVNNEAVEDVPNARDGQGTTFIAAGGTLGELNEILLHAETNGSPPSILEQTVYLPIQPK